MSTGEGRLSALSQHPLRLRRDIRVEIVFSAWYTPE